MGLVHAGLDLDPAARIDGEKLADNGARIERAYRLVLGRAPSAKERGIAGEFLTSAPTGSDIKLSPWEQFTQALLSTNEFTYLD